MQRIVSVSMTDPGAFASFLPGMAWKNKNSTPIWIGYEVDGMAVGTACAANYGDYFELDWIGVEKSYRRIGIGGLLLEEMQRIARQSGSRMFGASVCVGEPQMKEAEQFLLWRGFREVERVPRMSFPLQAVTEGPLHPREHRVPKEIRFLPEMLTSQIKGYNLKLGGKGSWLPSIEPEKLLPESCFFLKDERIAGGLCFSEAQDGVEVAWLQGNGAKMVAMLVLTGYAALARCYPPETILHLALMEPRLEDFVEKITGKMAVHDGDILWMMKLL